jgi:dihydroorotase
MLFRDATLADGRGRDVRLREGRIDAVAPTLAAERDERVVDVAGKHLFPGAVDVHVHFREPGFQYKETFESGSRAAAAGGVTTVVDQPNTDPATVTGAAFDEKAALARDSLVDFGINGGVLPDWKPDELFDRPLFAVGEVFLADSTGEMGIDFELFRSAVGRAGAEGVPVTVHAEDASLFDESVREAADGASDGPDGDGGELTAGADPDESLPTGADADADVWSAYRTPEAEAAAADRAVAAAVEADANVHIAHASTPEAIDLAAETQMTCEVTPHHLFLSRADLPELGTFGRANPPLRDESRRRAVYERVVDGTVDIIASDHAPHTVDEKETTLWEAPSGVPGVETLLPVLLAEAADDDTPLTLKRVRDLTARNPARVFDLDNKGTLAPGMDADVVVVDLADSRPIRADDLHSKAGWTPFEGHEGVFPELVTVRGHVVYEDGAFGRPVGRNVRTDDRTW